MEPAIHTLLWARISRAVRPIALRPDLLWPTGRSTPRRVSFPTTYLEESRLRGRDFCLATDGLSSRNRAELALLSRSTLTNHARAQHYATPTTARVLFP